MLPTDAKARKCIPITTGCIDYFPLALAEIAKVSLAGNEQHNPGKPLHWDRSKSTDHADCVGRHLTERGKIDSDGQRHSAKLAWRSLALLEEELEEAAKKEAAHDDVLADFTEEEREKIRNVEAQALENHVRAMLGPLAPRRPAE